MFPEAVILSTSYAFSNCLKDDLPVYFHQLKSGSYLEDIWKKEDASADTAGICFLNHSFS